MADAETALQARARRAYETGRVLLGLRRAALVVPMAALSWFTCARPMATCIDAVALAVLVAVFAWRGQELGRAVRIGLCAGAPALFAPVLIQLGGHACGRSFCALVPTICLLGGVAGGVLLVRWGQRRGLSTSGVLAAGIVAGLAGTLGCLAGGTGGLVGLAVGLTLGTAPLLAWRRA